jgi:glucoamylase
MGLGGPPGWPGVPHRWAPALKQAIGTVYEPQGAASPVWFTVSEGQLSEIFYPSPDQAQVGYVGFIVTDGQGYYSEQRAVESDPHSVISHVEFENEGMVVHISGEDRFKFYEFDQTIVTDTASPVVRVQTRFRWKQPGLKVFIVLKPAIGNGTAKSLGIADKSRGLLADLVSPLSQKPVSMALVSSARWVSASTGFVGFSDGWQDLSQNFRLTRTWDRVEPGNTTLTGEVEVSEGSEFTLDLALGFGRSITEAQTYANQFLQNVKFESARQSYESSWLTYLDTLQASSPHPSRTITENSRVRRSAQIIKMHEDKSRRGAIVSSLSHPTLSSNYNLVWPKDLYRAAMGLLAAGDVQTPVQILQYFKQTQLREGSWPKNFQVDGKSSFEPLPSSDLPSSDDAALPILLTSRLSSINLFGNPFQQGNKPLYSLGSDDYEMIRKATTFILNQGPQVAVDRWGESGGYTTESLAFKIAALKCAGQLVKDPESAKTADRWQALIEQWALLQSGNHGTNYYARLLPDTKSPELIDGGFLNLVRMGIRSPEDPRITSTLQLYDDPKLGIASANPDSPQAFFYRKNNRVSPNAHPSPISYYFPVLAGERGHYYVATRQMNLAQAFLFALEQSVTPNGLFPEQITAPPSSNRLRVRSGVACPFISAHAEDILLARSIEEGTVFDAPVCK